MPKKQPRNAFYFFMVDYKEEQRKKGIVFQNMAEVAEAAGPAWSSAPPPLRTKYETIAKAEKQRNNVPEKKFTSTGIPLSVIEQQERERKEAIEAERQDIKNFVMQKSVNKSILNEDIYLMDVNPYCKTGSKYLIGEVTLLRFSLQDGIKNMYHTLINPGRIPVGYALDVKIGAQEFGLSMPDEHEPRTDLMQVLAHIIDYLKQEDRKMKTLPIVFTLPDKVEPVVDFILQMCSCAGEDDSIFRIYKLDTLFFMLSNNIATSGNDGLPKESLALTLLKKDAFRYNPGLGCEAHEKEDKSVECTTSRVQRWAYTVLDYCCPVLGVETIPGRHLPPDLDVESILVYKEQRRGAGRPAATVAVPLVPSANTTLDERDRSQDTLGSLDTTNKSETRKHAPLRMPQADYSQEFRAPPPQLSLNSDTEFPQLSVGRGRGRSLTNSLNNMKL